VRWSNPSLKVVVYGDAFLSANEQEHVAAAVAASLEQVFDAARNSHQSTALLGAARDAFGLETYDTCTDPHVPPGLAPLAQVEVLRKPLAGEPVPLLRSPPVARVRAESGWFFGGSATWLPGYTTVEHSFTNQFAVGLRLGIGAAGVVDDPLNAQAFIEGGLTGEHQSLPGDDVTSVGFSVRLRVPSVVAFEGIILMPLAFALQQDCLFCLEWAATAASGGWLRIWRSRPLFGTMSWQISALRDVTLHYFPNEPESGDYRVEVFAPFVTARNVLPMAGETWSQSTDLYVDLGPSLSWSSAHPSALFGVFASISLSTRLFP
jgi:hypothetical protein